MLKNYIDKTQKYATFYNGILFNHLPMALHSLYKLGGSEEQIQSFIDNYEKKLVLRDESETEKIINHQNFKENLGSIRRQHDFETFFYKEYHKLGKENLVEKYILELKESIGSSAYHSIIKLSHALEMNNEDEIVKSISSLASSSQEFQIFPLNGNLTILDVYQTNIKKTCEYIKISGTSIVSRMQKSYELPKFKNVVESLSASELTLENLRKFLLLHYIFSNDNFTCIHHVTSLHAIENILGYIKSPVEKQNVLHAYWTALVSSIISVGYIKIEELNFNEKDLMSWQKIKELSCQSKNDHVIKLTYICYQNKDKSPLYQYIAHLKNILTS